MKQTIKKFARYSGLFRLSAWINNNALKILMYHGLSRSDDTNGLTNFDGKHLNIDEFENHLKLITKYCTPISLKTAIEKEKLPANPIVLTFDDGYKNNYTYAFPLLKKYQIPATVFITTGFVDQKHYMWSDQLEFIIENTHSGNIEIYWQDDKLTLELSADEEKEKTIRSIKKYAKNLPEQKKHSFTAKLQQILNIEYEWDKIPSLLLPLTWDEIREMRESELITFGSHTITHPILTKCTYEQQRIELMLSRQRISDEIGEDCILFAYPNGEFTDYNQKTIGLLKESGYLGAVTTVPGYVYNNSRDNFQLNRFGTGGSREELVTIITGLSRLVGTI